MKGGRQLICAGRILEEKLDNVFSQIIHLYVEKLIRIQDIFIPC